MKSYRIPGAKPIAGHYSPAVESNGFLFISGQVPVDPVTGKIIKGDFEDQFKQALTNVKNLVEAAGGTLEHIVKINIFVNNGEKWYEVNQIYKEFMGKHKPARTVLPVLPLHNGYEVEIEAIADLNKKDN